LKATQAAVASAMSELSSELALTTPGVTQLRPEPRK
jgi:hypothetical protein